MSRLALWLRALGLFLRAPFRFYPLQLPFFQLRRHPFLMGVWLFFWAMGLGLIGRGVGVEMIFFSPGEGLPEPAWGAFLWGLAFGLFTTAYHVSTFLLDGHHAGFLLRSWRNFVFLYALNNSLVPVGFLLFYLARYNKIHAGSATIRQEVLAILGGVLVVWIVGLVYFGRWRLSLRAFSSDLRSGKAGGPALTSGLWLISSGQRVWYYLAIPGGILPVERNVPEAVMLRVMEKILTRGHAAALILEAVIMLLVVGWGLIQGKYDLFLPASVVVLIMGAVVMMLLGALDYWLKRVGIGLLAFAGLMGLLGWLLIREGRYASPVFGLSYEQLWPYEEPRWNAETRLRDSADRAFVAEVLQRRLGPAPDQKPAFLWVTMSGGGWRSAYWTFLNLHLLDSLSGGQFYRRLAGITGASGGLIGAAFWRELHLFHSERAGHREEADHLTQDLLNPIFSAGLLGLLTWQFYWMDTLVQATYVKGRDYAFERRLIRNSRAFHDRRLKDYVPYEQEGKTPIIIFTPACVSNSQQLIVSTLPLSFLCWAGQRPVALELRQVVPADEVRMTSILRMNAAFPLVLPAVRLPTAPPLDIVDAGAIDNLGQSLTLRFLWSERAAIGQLASRVIWIEIRDLPPPGERLTGKTSLLQAFIEKLGGLYAAFAESRYHSMALNLEILRALYPIPIEKYVIYYTPGPEGYTPPLGFTLLEGDRKRLQRAAYQRDHIAYLCQILQRAGLCGNDAEALPLSP